VPVEVKSRKKPPILLEHHVLQLGAYCLLVEDEFAQTPPYGLLRYADATVKVDFTEQLRNRVLATVAAIRHDQTSRLVRRNHQEPARCLQCGYQHGCGEQRLQK
jgi:CRISPR-associated exonuclease Cas4